MNGLCYKLICMKFYNGKHVSKGYVVFLLNRLEGEGFIFLPSIDFVCLFSWRMEMLQR